MKGKKSSCTWKSSTILQILQLLRKTHWQQCYWQNTCWDWDWEIFKMSSEIFLTPSEIFGCLWICLHLLCESWYSKIKISCLQLGKSWQVEQPGIALIWSNGTMFGNSWCNFSTNFAQHNLTSFYKMFGVKKGNDLIVTAIHHFQNWLLQLTTIIYVCPVFSSSEHADRHCTSASLIYNRKKWNKHQTNHAEDWSKVS